MREVVLAFLLAVACGLVVVGAALLYGPAGFMAGGVLLAGWSWLTFGEIT